MNVMMDRSLSVREAVHDVQETLLIAIGLVVLVIFLFLRRFVGRVSDEPRADRIPWVHLDIAGVGMNKSGPHRATDKGPPAATVRALTEFVIGAQR